MTIRQEKGTFYDGTAAVNTENRLKQLESLASGPTLSKRKVAWTFDGQGRRVQQTTYDSTSGSYAVVEDLKFLSDGWRNIAELNATNNGLVRSYVWGLDLSGTATGAGGIAGLLSMNSTVTGAHFYSFDGNGNVVRLLKASDGSTSASYEFDPFGNTIRGDGALSRENPFRFSTKRTDNVSDLLLYELRPYSPSIARFLERDPAGESCGNNLYAFAGNDAVNRADLLGLVIICCPEVEGYFSSLGLVKNTHYKSAGPGYYVAIPGSSYSPGQSIENLIVWRMLLTRHAFKAKDMKLSGLKTHVQARIKISWRALHANFQVIGRERLSEADWRVFKQNPDGFFDIVNGTDRQFGCKVIATIIYESANHFTIPQEIRPYDRIWIPGDWGYIRNRTFERNRGAYPIDSGELWKGENVFHTGLAFGQEMFWGAFQAGEHDAVSEHRWFDDIRHWNPAGDPVWSVKITAPSIGLEPNHEPLPPELP